MNKKKKTYKITFYDKNGLQTQYRQMAWCEINSIIIEVKS